MGVQPVPGHSDACDAPSMAAPLYSSHTREVALDTVAAPLLDAIRAEAARNSLSLDGARAWSTHRDNRPATPFLGKLLARRSNPVDPDAEHDMVLVLQSTHLLFATHGVLGGTRAPRDGNRILEALDADVVDGDVAGIGTGLYVCDEDAVRGVQEWLL